ncbi:MAG TPA: hypothetical protein VHE30_18020 [Polyangiaceae bacterium]|nr:hypothetical protein [Polyangiaceae bacterium]
MSHPRELSAALAFGAATALAAVNAAADDPTTTPAPSTGTPAEPAPRAAPPPPPAAGAPPPVVEVGRAPPSEADRSEAVVTGAEPPVPAGQPPAPLEPEEPEGTPRKGTLPSYFIGLAGGFSSFRPSAESRGGIGGGGGIGLSAGLALWDQLTLAIGFGRLIYDDKRSFQDLVVECQSVGGTPVGCSNPEERSSVVAATYFDFDVGYQTRFRPGKSVSLVPGAFVGYLATPGGVKRGVQCDDCAEYDVPGVSAKGAYVGPSFKVTFGRKGSIAVGVRSQIMLTGDLAHMTLIGVEGGAP